MIPEVPPEPSENGLVPKGGGAGSGPCIVIAMSAREDQAFGPYGDYTA